MGSILAEVVADEAPRQVLRIRRLSAERPPAGNRLATGVKPAPRGHETHYHKQERKEDSGNILLNPQYFPI
jgi:hypothetical protein